MNKTKISLDITEQNVLAAIEAAGDNETLKNALKALFSVKEANKPTIDDYTTIKTYEDACEVLGLTPIYSDKTQSRAICQYINSHWDFRQDLPNHIIALLKLETISKALWGKDWQPKPDPTGREYYYYPYFALWTEKEIKDNEDRFKERGALLAADAGNGSSAGFGSLAASYRSSDAGASLGFRLCQETEEKAIYFGKQFIDLWADYLKYNFTTGERIY